MNNLDPTVPAVDGTAGRILVADDEENNRRILRDILEAQGHLVTLAEDGQQALEKALADPPDVVLLDIMMPKMDGYEVCNQLRKDSRTADLPILMVTALKDRANRLKGIQAGANDFLTKPIDAEEIRLRVRNAVLVKHLHDKVQDDYSRLKELEILRDNLTHMIVHDMRSPLMVITLGLEVHKKRSAGKLNEAEMEPVENATIAANKLIEMVSSLLDVSRLESGKMPIRLEECDLTGLTGEVIQSLKSMNQDCQLEMAQHDPVMVRCDRELIRRVLTNIGANAMKFIPKNGKVSYDIQNNDAGIRVLIIDNGPGIPREFHKKIFEKFGQVEAHQQRKMYSTGLGLTFCKLTVEAHGGELGVDSEVGKGSTFWFTLPRLNGKPEVS